MMTNREKASLKQWAMLAVLVGAALLTILSLGGCMKETYPFDAELVSKNHAALVECKEPGVCRGAFIKFRSGTVERAEICTEEWGAIMYRCDKYEFGLLDLMGRIDDKSYLNTIEETAVVSDTDNWKRLAVEHAQQFFPYRSQ